MNRKCNNLQTPKSEEQRQLDILKRMVEKRTSAVMLESFIKRLSIPSVSKYKGLTGDDLVNELTKDFSKQEAPEHKKYVHRDGRPLLTLNDFNRANLTRNERLAITEDIKENIVHNCLFDIKGGTGEIRSLEKVNENILAYKLQVMNELADILGVDEAVRVMIYLNGEKKVYAKVSSITGEAESGTIPFRSDNPIVLEKRENFSPGDRDKFTIVIWLEGPDPDCVDSIIGGELKLEMNITDEHVMGKEE